MTFLLLFNDLKFGKCLLFCCMTTGMQFLQFFIYESQVEYQDNQIYKIKKE